LNWSSVGDFLAMGGYGLYVWGSFVVAAIGAGWELLMLRQRRVSAIQQARDWQLAYGDDDDAAR